MRKLLLATSALLGASVGIAGIAQAGTLTPNAPNPAPGSITVTLNALVEAMAFVSSDSGTQPQNNGGNKVEPYGIATYVRIYPSFDGVLANGVKYGASIELRQNQGFVGSGGGTSGTQDTGTMYVQRGFVYVGADKFGKVELGSPVQPTELFQTGNPANFNTGGWDGDLPGVFRTGIPYFFSDSNDRANKIVYVSPQFAGFDFGISFEPNDFGNNYGKPFTRVSSSSCLAINPDGTCAPGAQVGRRRNTLDASARYQGTFGAFGVKAQLGGAYGGAVQSNDISSSSATIIPASPSTPGSVTAATVASVPYKNYGMATGGLSLTYAGLELDGNVLGGQFGPGQSNLQTGRTIAWIVGASYTVGPVIVGAAFNQFSSGYTNATSGNNTHGYGVAAGGTYTLAPGASVYLEYLYGHQHANGVDLVNGGASPFNNNIRAQAFGVGTAFKW